MPGPTDDKSSKSFRRIIGQKRMTSLSVFTKNGNILPDEEQSAFLKRMRKEWSDLGEEGRRSYQRKALLEKQQVPDTEEEKEAYLRRVCIELQDLTDFMKQLGWTFYFKILTTDSVIESPYVPAATIESPYVPAATIESPSVPTATSAQTASSDPVSLACPKHSYEEKRNLRRRVQKLFNGLYHEATGNYENFPYKRHKENPQLAVIGMPHGVPFKEPFSYGFPALQAILNNSNHIKMVPLNQRQVPLQEEFTGVVSSLPEGDHSVALSSHGSGDVAVIAEVVDITPVGGEDIVAPPPQESADVPANVNVVHPLDQHTEEASGVLDVPVIQKRPLDGIAKAGYETPRIIWSSEEIKTIYEQFGDELHGKKTIRMDNILTFIRSSNFQRTPSAVQNYLLRKRKENITKGN
ncbi:hypothetical protein C0Q70_08030 [Pomacea canaliculata]|uniref:Uncharacterized protein n=1 Tax=Pomacea canaliculata TaxID=400727 RepID=A0A2T7PGP9_POMCA|nr:uncharacterized protein LOC112562784 [Pomacea canaliculata]PVD32588.1 hypothetical protein C0Q70_08030 [Pomacea canaliculata]